MLNWLKRREPITCVPREPDSAPQAVVSGKYLSLYKYLYNRYADTVVLTFGEIESLLGFALPDQARLNRQWWANTAVTTPGIDHSDSWIRARRIATPNLMAETVAFQRAS